MTQSSRFTPPGIRPFAALLGCHVLAILGTTLSALLFLTMQGMTSPWVRISIGPAVLLCWLALPPVGGRLTDLGGGARLLRQLMLANLVAAVTGSAALALRSPPLLLAGIVAGVAVLALSAPLKYTLLFDLAAPGRRIGAGAAIVASSWAATLASAVLGLMIPLAPHVRPLPDTALPIWAWLLRAAPVLLALLACGCAGSLTPGVHHPAEDKLPTATATRFRQLARPAVAHGWSWIIMLALCLLTPQLAHGSGDGAAWCLGTLLAGLGAGCVLATRLCGSRIVLLPTALGSTLTGLCMLLLWMAAEPPAHGLRLPTLLLFLAASGVGLLAVPTLARVRSGAAPQRRGWILAGLMVLSSAGMTATLLISVAATAFDLTGRTQLGILALASLALGLLILTRPGANPAAELVWILFRLVYRVEVRGLEHLPPRGTSFVVTPNHVSWLDAALLFSVLDRPVFAIDGAVSRLWFVRPFLRVASAVPVDAAHPLSMRRLIEQVRAGRPAVIFPEGRITVTGSIMRVQDGAAMTAEKTGALIVPARIEGLEATPFSRLTRAQVRRRLFPRVRLTLLPPRTLTVRPDLSGRRRREASAWAMQDMLSAMMLETTDTAMGVFEAVAQAGRRHGLGRTAVQDPVRGRLSYRKLLAGAAVLGARLAPHANAEQRIGLMLPNANAAAASLLGLLSAGIVPVLLNPRSGLRALQAAITATGFTTIATSRQLVQRAKLEPLVEALSRQVAILYLEDLPIGRVERLRGLLRGGRPLAAVDPDAPALVLMTSGTSGLPKGVVLSHRNILANIAQTAAVIDFGPADRILNVLPLFHSFGLTAGLLLPLVHGMPVFLYPSPLDYRTIPMLASSIGATALFGTNSFLTGYARSAHPTDFRTLRLVVAGGEAVTAWTRQIWAESFGLRILEGYGVTETSPILALNTPLSNRNGTVGRLVPGVAARLVPVEGIAQGGRLLVSGPNVMLGYLRPENPGVLEPPPGGWHDTGDIVSISPADGHVSIRGRAARFAKVAGEMVSLGLIERIAGELWPGALVVAVALPDPRKGERVVLLTDRSDASRGAFIAQARLSHLPEVAFPAELRISPTLPMLGSGKPDIMEATRLTAAGALGERVA